jgi:hypothetical protein
MADDPSLNVASGTPQALVDLSNALSDFSDKLDDFIKSSGNPFTPAMQQLRNLDTHIAADAALIARLAVEAMADDVRSAVADLKKQVDRAKQTLQNIKNVKTALSLVAAVFSVAASISTGDPLASAKSVLALVQVISNAVDVAST